MVITVPFVGCLVMVDLVCHGLGGSKFRQRLQIADRGMPKEQNSGHNFGRILPQSLLDQVDDFARSYEIVGGLWVRFIVRNAVVEGGVVVDQMVLDHSRKAMMHLTLSQAGMEFQSRESQSFVSL
jgi:hypothetical protein